VYEDIVYHHGAGFRGASSIVDRFETGVLTSVGRVQQMLAKLRLKRRLRRNLRMSNEVYDAISRDGDYVARAFLTPQHGVRTP
jgi:hypothetical protein